MDSGNVNTSEYVLAKVRIFSFWLKCLPSSSCLLLHTHARCHSSIVILSQLITISEVCERGGREGWHQGAFVFFVFTSEALFFSPPLFPHPPSPFPLLPHPNRHPQSEISWETFMTARLITDRELQFIRRYDKRTAEAKLALLAEVGV